MSSLVRLDDATLQARLDTATTPVVVDFMAPWCGPCRAMAPILDEAVRSLGTRVVMAKVNVDESPRSASRFGIRNIPTLVLFEQGQPVETATGLAGAAQLLARLQRRLGRSDA